MNFNRQKLNRAIVVLMHQLLVMERPCRIRISPQNKQRLQKDTEAIAHLLEFAERAMKELGIGEEASSASEINKRLNVRPAILDVH